MHRLDIIDAISCMSFDITGMKIAISRPHTICTHITVLSLERRVCLGFMYIARPRAMPPPPAAEFHARALGCKSPLLQPPSLSKPKAQCPNPTCHKPVPGAVAPAFAFHTGSNARSPQIRKCCWMAVTSRTMCLCQCASGTEIISRLWV